MSKVIYQFSQSRGLYKPLSEFSVTQLEVWRHRTAYYRMMHRWGSTPPGVWNRPDRGTFGALGGSERRHKEAIETYNKWVARKARKYNLRVEMGLPASPPRVRRAPLPEKTWKCKVINCPEPAVRIFTGMHLCQTHIRKTQEALRSF